MENQRDAYVDNRSSGSDELQSNDSLQGIADIDSIQDISLADRIDNMDASFDGAFDGTKIASIHELKENEDIALKNAVSRSDKRFETAVGMSMVREGYIKLQPVSTDRRHNQIQSKHEINIHHLVHESRIGVC